MRGGTSTPCTLNGALGAATPARRSRMDLAVTSAGHAPASVASGPSVDRGRGTGARRLLGEEIAPQQHQAPAERAARVAPAHDEDVALHAVGNGLRARAKERLRPRPRRAGADDDEVVRLRLADDEGHGVVTGLDLQVGLDAGDGAGG